MGLRWDQYFALLTVFAPILATAGVCPDGHWWAGQSTQELQNLCFRVCCCSEPGKHPKNEENYADSGCWKPSGRTLWARDVSVFRPTYTKLANSHVLMQTIWKHKLIIDTVIVSVGRIQCLAGVGQTLGPIFGPSGAKNGHFGMGWGGGGHRDRILTVGECTTSSQLGLPQFMIVNESQE